MPSFNDLLDFDGYRYLTGGSTGVTLDGSPVSSIDVSIHRDGVAHLSFPYTSGVVAGIWRVGSTFLIPAFVGSRAFQVTVDSEMNWATDVNIVAGLRAGAHVDTLAHTGCWVLPLSYVDFNLGRAYSYITPWDMLTLFPGAYDDSSGFDIVKDSVPHYIRLADTSTIYSGLREKGRVWAFQRDLFHSEENIGTLAAPVYRVRTTCVWFIRADRRIHSGLTLTDRKGVAWNVIGVRVLQRGRVWALDCRALPDE